VNRRDVYRVKERDPEFTKRWEDTLEATADALEAGGKKTRICGRRRGNNVWCDSLFLLGLFKTRRRSGVRNGLGCRRS